MFIGSGHYLNHVPADEFCVNCFKTNRFHTGACDEANTYNRIRLLVSYTFQYDIDHLYFKHYQYKSRIKCL